MDINNHTVLKLASGTNIKVIDSTMQISYLDQHITVSLEFLSLLETFIFPIPFDAAMTALMKKFPSPERWIQISSFVLSLYKVGILQTDTGTPRYATGSVHYDNLAIHVSMLQDQIRVKSYLAALQAVVTPSDIVVDIGTGTGILALAAAKLGAKHVYAIEKSSIAHLAQQMFIHNGVADRITLVQGDSRDVELPERGTVLVSEMLGKDAFDEDMIAIYYNAQRRFLTEGAKIIPSAIKVYALLGYLEHENWPNKVMNDETVKQWRDAYGVDYTPMLRLHSAVFYGYLKYRQMQQVTWRTEPVLLGEYSLYNISTRALPTFEVTAQLVTAGEVNLLAVYPDVELAPNCLLPRNLVESDEKNHWLYPIWLHHQSINFEANESVHIHYKPIREASFNKTS